MSTEVIAPWRIPKYRAWDKTRNIYGQVLEIAWPCGDDDSKFPEGHKGRLSLFNPKNERDCGFWGIWIEKAVLEEYIGFIDKNGREVFQGDIITDAKKTYSIEWNEEELSWVLTKPGYKGHILLSSLNPRFWQVVGNVHENPRLLEASCSPKE